MNTSCANQITTTTSYCRKYYKVRSGQSFICCLSERLMDLIFSLNKIKSVQFHENNFSFFCSTNIERSDWVCYRLRLCNRSKYTIYTGHGHLYSILQLVTRPSQIIRTIHKFEGMMPFLTLSYNLDHQRAAAVNPIFLMN